MLHALILAKQAAAQGEVPVGAVVVHDGEIIGEGFNGCIAQHDATAHAEIVAIRDASNQIKNYRLSGCSLYVTLEPCLMCAGSILNARIDEVVFGARDERQGAAGSILNALESDLMDRQCRVTAGVLAEQSADLLQSFFKRRR